MGKYTELIKLFFYILKKDKPRKPRINFLLFVAPLSFKINRLLVRPTQLIATNSTENGKTLFCFFEKNWIQTIDNIDTKGYGTTLKDKKKFIDDIFELNPKVMSFTNDIYIFILLKMLSYKLNNKVKFDWIAARYQNLEMEKNLFQENFFKRFFFNLTYTLMLKYSDIVNSIRIYQYEYFMVTKKMDRFITSEIIVGGRTQEYLNIINKNNDVYEIEDIIQKYQNKIVLVSRLEACKRASDGIEAFLKVKNELNLKSCLVIIGSGNEFEKYKTTYKDDDIYFMGAFDHEKTLNSLKYFNFGIMLHGGSSIIEAALAKLPVIAYGFQAMPEYVVDKYSGILIDLNDTIDLEESIIELSNNHDLCRKYGQNAYDVVITRYSEENIRKSINKMDRIMFDY